MACIANDPENPTNWLRWHRGSNLRLPVACVSLCNDGAPLGAPLLDYRQYDVDTYLPAVNGDTFKFFLNSENALQLSGYTLAVGLIWRGQRLLTLGAFSSSVTQINYGTAPNIRQRFYGELTFNSLPDDVYTPYLYDTADPDQVLYLTNAVRLVNYSRWQRETTLVKFRHGATLAGVDYSLVPADWYQQFRVPFALYAPTYPESEEKYTDRNGTTRTTERQIQLVYGFGSDLITQLDFQAAVLMLAHDELYLNGKLMRQSSALEVVDDYSDVNALTVKGKVEDTTFAQILSSC